MKTINRIALNWVLITAVATWASTIPGLMAQDRPAIARPSSTKSSKAIKKKAAAKPAAKSSDKTAGEEKPKGAGVDIGKILPKGRSLRGVKLPSYSGDRLSSLMTATTMKRLDDKHLDMQDLRIIMYAKPGEADTLISTDRGIYNLEKEEITSDTRTRIEQEGVFDLEGDNMIFDAVTQKGKMTGDVKMLLYSMADGLMPNGAKDKLSKGKENKGGK
ncbi:MAG: hypothetical protein L3J39_00350 [Verrucomicrobiales bacterium]|nr:hypothetical protein [Verrucomicrobiales bacterium]